jgi:hypothetical protein
VHTRTLDTKCTPEHSIQCAHQNTRYNVHTRTLDTMCTPEHSIQSAHQNTRYNVHTRTLDTMCTPEHSIQCTHQQRTAVFRTMYRPFVRLIQVGNVGFPTGIRAGAFRLQGISTAADSTGRFTVNIIILSNNHRLSFPAISPVLPT